MDHRAHSVKELKTVLKNKHLPYDFKRFCFFKETKNLLFSKFFFIYIIFCVTISSIYFQISFKQNIKEDLSFIESSINNSIEKQFAILDYASQIIINQSLINHSKSITYFLRDLQNLSSITDSKNFLNKTTLIWIGKDFVPIGSLGVIDQKVFKVDHAFLNLYADALENIIISEPYQNKHMPSIQYVDTCLSVVDKNKIKIGMILMHFEIDDFLQHLIPQDILKKYHLSLIHESPNDTATHQSELADDSLSKIKTKHSTEVKSFNIQNNQNSYYQKLSKMPYIVSISLKSHSNYWIKTALFSSQATLALMLLYLFILYLFVLIKNHFLSSMFKILRIFSKTSPINLQPENFPIKINTNNKFSLEFFKVIAQFKKKRQVLEVNKKEILNLKNAIQMKSKQYEEEHQKLETMSLLIDKFKYYTLENIKFKKVINEHLKSILFKAITHSEFLINECLDNSIIPIDNKQQIDLVRDINLHLKDFFNLRVGSQKELLDPTSAISEALSAIMIHAILRNIEIKTYMKNNLSALYFNKIRLQMILIGLVYQSIDATSNQGTVVISVEKLLIQDEFYLKILIEDESYQIYKHAAENSFLVFEHFTLENIKLILEEEGGFLEIMHHLNKGKSITLLFPYRDKNKKHHQPGKNNVYPLF